MLFAIKNKSGMSLLEVMVAVGISSVVIMTTTKTISNLLRGQNEVTTSQNIDVLQRSMTDFLSVNQICINSLAGVPMDDTKRNSDFVDAAGNVVYDFDNPAALYAGNKVRLASWVLTWSTTIEDVANPLVQGTLTVIFEKVGPSTGPPYVSRVINLRARLDGGINGPILANADCTAYGMGGANYHWDINGNHIFNTNIGNVGIGINNPTERLEVAGTTRISENLGVGGVALIAGSLGVGLNFGVNGPAQFNDNVTVGVVGNEKDLNVLGNAEVSRNLIVRGNMGVDLNLGVKGTSRFSNNIFIGASGEERSMSLYGSGLITENLSVGGYVKVGGTALGCDNTTKGGIRYNETEGAIEFCHNNNWNAIYQPGSSSSWYAQATSLVLTVPSDGILVIMAAGGRGGGRAGANLFRMYVDGVERETQWDSVNGGHGGSRAGSLLYRMPVVAGTTHTITLTHSIGEAVSTPSIMAILL